MKRVRIVLSIGLVAALVACGHSPQATRLPPLPKLETVTVAAGDTVTGRTWDGVVEAVQQADLTAQTSGRVSEIHVDVNDRVARDMVLLRLTAVEQQAGANTARAQLHAAEATAVEAEATYARYVALAKKQFVSGLQLDQVRATRDTAIAARDAAHAQLAQAEQPAQYTVVRAPFAGIVSARRIEPGESVAPGQPLLSVFAPGALRIEVQVPQSDAAAIRAINKARVLLPDGREFDAATITIFPAADAATHSVGIRVNLPELESPPQPGITARVMFPVAGDKAALQIPRSVLVRRGEITGVYVLAGNQLSLRQLRLGQYFGDRVEVLAGLSGGETLAADPVSALQALVAQRKAAGVDNE